MPEVKQIRQFALKTEAVEGTAETLAAADVIEVIEPKLSPAVEKSARNPARSTLGRKKAKVGGGTAPASFQVELRGTGTATELPDYMKVLHYGGWRLEHAYSIAIGAIASGPFQHGETITGGTSSATGRVLFPTADGAASVYFVPISGTLQTGEVLTGGTSGATATSSGAPAALGRAARPFSPGTFRSIAIGAVTSGPFQAGERITGGTSSANGRVLQSTKTGDSTLYFESLSGTFQNSEVLTGEDSGATATSSAGPADAHYGGASATIGLYEGLLIKKAKGARCKTKLVFEEAKPCHVEAEFEAVRDSETDGSLLSGTSPLATAPPVFDGSVLTYGTYSPIFERMEIDMGVALSPRRSGSNPLSYYVTDREPTFSIDPEVVSEATQAFFGDWAADTERVIDVVIGSSAGNRARIYVPEMQLNEVADGERESIVTHGLSGQLNDSSDADQDLTILSY